jgi:dihydroneopterin aldolase
MMDRITIKDAGFFCNIGVSSKERARKQKIFVDVGMFLDTRKAAQKDDLKFTINYSDVYHLMKSIAEKKEYRLIETLADGIAEGILGKFNVKKVDVEVRKRLPNFESSVSVAREKNG